MRGAGRVGALTARVLQRAFRHGPKQIPLSLRDATGAPRPAERKFGRGECLGSRRTIRLPWSRSLRHSLSVVVRRITLGHSAARLASRRSRAHSGSAKCKIFVTPLTLVNG